MGKAGKGTDMGGGQITHVFVMFYRAVVQAFLLFGYKLWVMSEYMDADGGGNPYNIPKVDHMEEVMDKSRQDVGDTGGLDRY